MSAQSGESSSADWSSPLASAFWIVVNASENDVAIAERDVLIELIALAIPVSPEAL